MSWHIPLSTLANHTDNQYQLLQIWMIVNMTVITSPQPEVYIHYRSVMNSSVNSGSIGSESTVGSGISGEIFQMSGILSVMPANYFMNVLLLWDLIQNLSSISSYRWVDRSVLSICGDQTDYSTWPVLRECQIHILTLGLTLGIHTITQSPVCKLDFFAIRLYCSSCV